jgi:glycolate oxidase
MKAASLFEALAAVVPADCLKIAEEDMRPYECDGLSMYRALPKCVVLPEDEAQLAAVIKICHAQRVSVVARGAGTGLSGGAMPDPDSILLSTAKMMRMISIDPLACTAVVQPGVRNLAISEAVSQYGLYYAPDPSSQIACSIGGNVAENSGGVHCLKYGLTVHNIRKLRVVLMTGEIVEIGSDSLDACAPGGYDLLSLMIGSEGLLGIVTEVTVKLTPKPQLAQVALASFASVETAGAAVNHIIAAGIIPAGLEMMDKIATEAVEGFVHAGYDLNAAAILLCESDGTPEEVADEMARVSEVLRSAGATDIKVSQNEAERLRYWSGRKNAFPATGRISPDYYCMDGTIPRAQLPRVLNVIGELSIKYNLRCANVFHAGDGNLHPLIMFDANIPGELERAEEFGAEILELCVEVGGTITGEHGVGVEKIDQMCVQFSPKELTRMHEIKHAFDEHALLNPGKAVPTLHRCAEFGKMRISKGKPMPFADLPRF